MVLLGFKHQGERVKTIRTTCWKISPVVFVLAALLSCASPGSQATNCTDGDPTCATDTTGQTPYQFTRGRPGTDTGGTVVDDTLEPTTTDAIVGPDIPDTQAGTEWDSEGQQAPPDSNSNPDTPQPDTTPEGGEEGGEEEGGQGGEEEGGQGGEEEGGEGGEEEGGQGGEEEGGEGDPPVEPLPYPEKTGYDIKGIQPDFWPNKEEIAGNGTGSVAMNLVWKHWEPSLNPAPCGGGDIEYDGHCFTIPANVDEAIRDYSDLGVHITGVLYGVPGWARQNVNCSPVVPGFEIFCIADNPQDYGRFTGMIAQRYNGLQGNGRVIDFVIHNEVNANDWFDIGCGQGTPCDPDAWVQAYAENYMAAYDFIVSEQPHAKVLMSFDHHFGAAFQIPNDTNPKLSVQWFLEQIAPKLGDRQWRVAYHPYPPNLLNPAFSPFDFPKVTYGNLGMLLGFLHDQFPNDPHAWDVQLTESGVNSVAPQGNPEAQAAGVCDSLYNALGTPGISNYIYHRMKDHPVETASGLGCGLADEFGNLKPAWSVWATSNLVNQDPPQLSCGFENLPYTRLVRGFGSGQGHWATTRKLPDGMVEEQVYGLHREEQAGTVLLFECRTASGDNFVSKDAHCNGADRMGPLGWIHTDSVPGTTALYHCNSGSGDHMISPDPNCEIYETEELLGYAVNWTGP